MCNKCVIHDAHADSRNKENCDENKPLMAVWQSWQFEVYINFMYLSHSSFPPHLLFINPITIMLIVRLYNSVLVAQSA